MSPWTWRAFGFVVVVALGAGGWFLFGGEPTPEQTSADAPAGTVALTGTAQPAPEATTMAVAPEPGPDSVEAPVEEALPAPPTFDVVRVEKDGSTVAAGKAPAGSEVMLLDGVTALASTDADLNGEWALVLDQPLTPGDRELSLAAVMPDGTVVPSEQVVVVHVPEPQVAAVPPETTPEAAEPLATTEPTQPLEEAADSTQAGSVTASSDQAITVQSNTVTVPLAETSSDSDVVVALTSKSGTGGTEILQAPAADLPPDAVVIEAVDYDLDGKLILSGRAQAGAKLLAYLDDQPVGQAVADDSGRWVLLPDQVAGPGEHRIRVDQLDDSGAVVARAETPFSRTEEIARAAEGRFVEVVRGQSLWRIARGEYGEGLRYTVIYEANKGQIRDPDLIYPGQVFLIPASN